MALAAEQYFDEDVDEAIFHELESDGEDDGAAQARDARGHGSATVRSRLSHGAVTTPRSRRGRGARDGFGGVGAGAGGGEAPMMMV